MSKASEPTSPLPVRALHEEEIELISALIGRTANASLKNALVVDMKDGNMGSIRFARDESRIFGKVVAEAQYTDEDGICVSITLNADNKGDLFEVDFWKVNFSPLKHYPRPPDLRIGTLPTSES